MHPAGHRKSPRRVCEDSFDKEPSVRRARVHADAREVRALLRRMSDLNMRLLGCLLRISSLFPALREAGNAFWRVVWEFEAQDETYERRIGAPGVGRGRAPDPAPRRCLHRMAIYDVIVQRCTATHDHVHHVTGFPVVLFDAFVNMIRLHFASLSAMQGLSVRDRLCYFFSRCRSGITYLQMEALFGFHHASAQRDFQQILGLLYHVLVHDSRTATIRWFERGSLARKGRQCENPARFVPPADSCTIAQRLREKAPLGVIGGIDGILIRVVRPGTRLRERLEGKDNQRRAYSGYTCHLLPRGDGPARPDPRGIRPLQLLPPLPRGARLLRLQD